MYTQQQAKNSARMMFEEIRTFNEMRRRVKNIFWILFIGLVIASIYIYYILITKEVIKVAVAIYTALFFLPAILALVLYLCDKIVKGKYEKQFIEQITKPDIGYIDYTPSTSWEYDRLNQLETFRTTKDLPKGKRVNYEAKNCFIGKIKDIEFKLSELHVALTKKVYRDEKNLWEEEGLLIAIQTTLPEGRYISSPSLVHREVYPEIPVPESTLNQTNPKTIERIQRSLNEFYGTEVAWVMHVQNDVAYAFIRETIKTRKGQTVGKKRSSFTANLFSDISEETIENDINMLILMHQVAEIIANG